MGNSGIAKMTITLRKLDEDGQWFSTHSDRRAHIRKPIRFMDQDTISHRTQFRDECENEFRSLGDHNKDRRRILLWKVPKDNVYYDPKNPQILKIPFLLFSDESVEDADTVLLPLIREIMLGKAN